MKGRFISALEAYERTRPRREVMNEHDLMRVLRAENEALRRENERLRVLHSRPRRDLRA